MQHGKDEACTSFCNFVVFHILAQKSSFVVTTHGVKHLYWYNPHTCICLQGAGDFREQAGVAY